MSEYPKKNPTGLRHCLLYEFLRLKSVEDVMNLPLFAKYNDFCKLIGDDVMEYREFEFWFYRFLNEEFDLNYERDEDKKIYELSDMPIDIMKNILEYLDIFDRLPLMKISRSLRRFIGDQKSFVKKLEFLISDQAAQISIENRRIIIKKSGDDCYRWFGDLENGKFIEGVCYWKQALEDLKNTLKLPNLRVEEFHFKMDISNYFGTPSVNVLETFNKAVDSLKVPIQQWNVKKLYLFVYSVKPILKILSYIKPGYLTTLKLRLRKVDNESMERVVEMEQWKQAKCFTMKLNAFPSSLHNLYHFKEFDVRVNRLTKEDICQMKEILFNSPDFENCTFRVDDYVDMHSIRHEFGKYIPENEDTYHYPIPNSSEYFEIDSTASFDPGFTQKIRITRKKK